MEPEPLIYTLHPEFPDAIEAEWNELLDASVTHVPFLRHEYLRTWWQTRGGGEWPQAELAVITARRTGKLVGVAPLFLTAHQGVPSLLLLGSIEISDYLDLIARPRDMQPFLNGLLPWLESIPLQWQKLDLYNLLEYTPTLKALAGAAELAGWQMTTEQLQHSPYIPLPGDWETYLASIDKKQRHEIRRKMRRLEEAGVPFRWYVASESSELDEEVEDFLALMANDPEKQVFLTPLMREQMRMACRCAFDKGCLHLAFLEINGKKAAGNLSFDYLNRLWLYNSGVDRQFMEYSPGWVLLGHLLKWANENGRNEFDFMRGDEEYKYRFGAVDRFVVRATLSR